MRKFTFIFEFEKGTYVKQFISSNLEKSLVIWFDSLNDNEIPQMNKDVKKQLEVDILNESPTPLHGMEDVWCMLFLLNRKTALLNIVGS